MASALLITSFGEANPDKRQGGKVAISEMEAIEIIKGTLEKAPVGKYGHRKYVLVIRVAFAYQGCTLDEWWDTLMYDEDVLRWAETIVNKHAPSLKKELGLV